MKRREKIHDEIPTPVRANGRQGQARDQGSQILHRAAAAGHHAASRGPWGTVHAAWDVTCVTHRVAEQQTLQEGAAAVPVARPGHPHTALITRAELDRVWGGDCWTYQAGKMPDANDGDVGAFPFLKRHLRELGELTAADDIFAGFKKAWKSLTPAVCKNIRARVVRNMHMVIIKEGGNYYDESMTKAEFG